MRIIDELPDKNTKNPWNEIADQLRAGKTLEFSQGEDFDDLEKFRGRIISSMRIRMMFISTRKFNQGKSLAVVKREA